MSVVDEESLAAMSGAKPILGKFGGRYPSEQVLFVAAATALQTDGRDIVGRDSRRILHQRRGLLIITANRLYFSSAPASALVLFNLLAIATAIGAAVLLKDWMLLFLVVPIGMTLLQRIPRSHDLRLDSIGTLDVAPISGARGVGTALVVQVADQYLQFAFTRPLDHAVIETLGLELPSSA